MNTNMKDTPFYERLLMAQVYLKAPKGQKNDFGGYAFRSAEDIEEKAKPINRLLGLHLTLSDDMIEVGGRVYVKATATLRNIYNSEEKETVTAFARESQSKKGMDDSQITGSASSYARKYALNGLYLIDNEKDADTNEFSQAIADGFNEARGLLLNRLNKVADKTGQDVNKLLEFAFKYVEKNLKEKTNEINDRNIFLIEKYVGILEGKAEENKEVEDKE